MKKYVTLILILTLAAVLSGCAKGVVSCPSAEKPDAVENSTENMISASQLGQGILDAVQAEWEAWNAKDDLQKAVSSHLPGHCYKKFDTWAECEEFLDFSVFNPLENSEFEKGSYVGMPIGYADASRFYVSFYGTSEGQVQWIYVESGYRDGDIRITVNAQIFVDTPKENMDNAEPLITEDSGERYVASEALLARGPVTYNVRVIGEANKWEEVRATLDKVLPYFTENINE